MQMSEPKTSLPLHSSWTRRARRTFGSDNLDTSPKQYTVNPPIGGMKSLISPRVMSSGKEPPVCSKRDRRSVASSVYPWLCNVSYSCRGLSGLGKWVPIPNLSATPGRYHTGSTANFVTANSPNSFKQILPSTFNLPSFTEFSSSGSLM